MASDNQSKYGANRNVWRKYYPIGAPRREPQVVALVDTETNSSYSLNLQTTIRHRDFFKIIYYATGSFSSGSVVPPVTLGEYDEGLITFNNASSGIVFFNFLFSDVPYIVLTIEDSTPSTLSQSNINVFGIEKNNQYCNVGLSAPFSGTVRYRAVYSPAYPAYFTSSYTGSIFTASAGAAGVNWSSEYTASFSALVGGAPTQFRSTPWDGLFGQLADVALDPDETSFTATSANGTISAPYSGAIDFIAYS